MTSSDASALIFNDHEDTVAQRNAAQDILETLQNLFDTEDLTKIDEQMDDKYLSMEEPDQHEHLLNRALEEAQVAEDEARVARQAAQETANLIQRYKENQ
jgi:hypothetical protein